MMQPLYIAFVWHMHQPCYRDLVTGACPMPWVRLHATKDYVAMVKRLEPFPSIHQTFNLVPSLLDQLEAYLPPRNGSDDFLEASRKDAAQLSETEQRFLLQWFFLAHLERMIKPYPRYHDLLAKRGPHPREDDWPRILKRFKTQDYRDLQVWFNLAWIDPWLRRQNPQLAHLETKGGQFTEGEKCSVLEQHLGLIAQVIPAYRAAATRGQIELTSSPYYHPIMPLLCDLRAAHAALPNLPLPQVPFHHPEDARWHLQEGLRRHQAAFGALPEGLWPPEGSVSEELVSLALEANLRWIATDEAILWLTLRRQRAAALLYRPHVLRRNGKHVAIIFRDRELSDLIGFVYSQWDPQSAVADFLKRLGEIHRQVQSVPDPALVSIILDGENAWECYPDDGHAFLTGLYEALANDSRFHCVTVSEFLQRDPLERAESLPELFSGSWIDANFATWIGHPEKNAAWEHLARARDALEPLARDDPARASAWKSLGAAEGSDWLWWFGDTHFTAQAELFDRLFRQHLANCYRLAGEPVPAELTTPIRQPGKPPLYEPTGPIHPTIDGRESSYYEWLYAGQLDLQRQYAAAQRGAQCLRRLCYGFDQTSYYIRLDLDRAWLLHHPSWRIDLLLTPGRQVQISALSQATSEQGSATEAPAVQAVFLPGNRPLACALGRILEVAIPIELLGLKVGERLPLAVSLTHERELMERYPAQEAFELTASSADLHAATWSA